MSSLAKFTSLEQFRAETTEKNVECAKVLLGLAKSESNGLKGSWIHILKCISRLDYLHIIKSGVKSDAELFNTGANEVEIRYAEIH